MRALLLIIVCLAATRPAFSGIVRWTSAQSPKMITADWVVAPTDTLIIEAGVEVIFTGTYRIQSRGIVKAMGTATQPIVFRAQDTTNFSLETTTAGGWKGLHLQGYHYRTYPDSFVFCRFQNIKADTDPALTSASSLVLKNCVFAHNRAMMGPASPAFLFSVNATNVDSTMQVVVDSCQFYQNAFRFDLLGVLSGRFTLANTSFQNNSGSNAVTFIGSNNSQVKVIHNDFSNNVLTVEDLGAPLRCYKAHTVLIQGNKFHNNFTRSTGALILDLCSGVVENNSFTNNRVESTTACGTTGGGVVFLSDYDGDTTLPKTKAVIVRNNLFLNNSVYAFPPVTVFSHQAYISNNTFVNNATDGAGTVVGIEGAQNKIWIKNNIFHRNTTRYQNEVMVNLSGTGDLTLAHNVLPRPVAGSIWSLWGQIRLMDTSGNLTGVDPLLTNVPLGIGYSATTSNANLQPLASSPCVDAGDTLYAQAAPYDYLNRARVFGNQIDMGAYEYGSATLGVVAPDHQPAVSVYPNPAAATFFVVLAQAARIVVVDAAGKIELHQTLEAGLQQLEAIRWPAGVYWMQVSYPDGKKSETLRLLRL